MPKVIVLFFGADNPTITLAESAAKGAKGVRFTQVEVRSGSAEQSTIGRRRRPLESASRIRDFDGEPSPARRRNPRRGAASRT